MGNEVYIFIKFSISIFGIPIFQVIPDIIDRPPRFPLDLTYKTIRTFPGMRLTADMTKFKPMLKWPAQPDSLYTVVLSNLDINSRRNR